MLSIGHIHHLVEAGFGLYYCTDAWGDFKFTSPVVNTKMFNGRLVSDGGGMTVLTWLSAERRGMEMVRPCPSIG